MAKIWGFENSRRNVKSAVVNWFYTTEIGEESTLHKVGAYGVVRIDYHTPAGEGDRHYIDVYNDDGTVVREFNINHIEFTQDLRD